MVLPYILPIKRLSDHINLFFIVFRKPLVIAKTSLSFPFSRFKENVNLTGSSKYVITQNGQKTTFTINGLSDDDKGRYMCKASNTAGAYPGYPAVTDSWQANQMRWTLVLWTWLKQREVEYIIDPGRDMTLIARFDIFFT